MKRTKTPREWYNEHVDRGELFDSITKSMADAVREDSLDMGGEVYVGLVQDIISSGHGRYIPFYALEYFDYDIDTENTEKYSLESVLNELDSFTVELEDIIEDDLLKGSNIEVVFDYWESDGTFCLMCLISKEDYESNKKKYEAYVNGDIKNPFEN